MIIKMPSINQFKYNIIQIYKLPHFNTCTYTNEPKWVG